MYEIEHIDNPCYVTLAVNPKEYLELFEDYYTDKKHKGIKKGSRGMKFSNYSNRINSLVSFDTFEKTPVEYKEVAGFTVLKGGIVTTE